MKSSEMDLHEHETPWIKRVEELIKVLEGSTIGELELTEAGTEIIIRRRPDMMMVSIPTQPLSLNQPGAPIAPGTGGRAAQEDRGVAITAPLTGVFYSALSPASPPFMNLRDVVHVAQVVALLEALKVFNELQFAVSGH